MDAMESRKLNIILGIYIKKGYPLGSVVFCKAYSFRGIIKREPIGLRYRIVCVEYDLHTAVVCVVDKSHLS